MTSAEHYVDGYFMSASSNFSTRECSSPPCCSQGIDRSLIQVFFPCGCWTGQSKLGWQDSALTLGDYQTRFYPTLRCFSLRSSSTAIDNIDPASSSNWPSAGYLRPHWPHDYRANSNPSDQPLRFDLLFYPVLKDSPASFLMSFQ